MLLIKVNNQYEFTVSGQKGKQTLNGQPFEWDVLEIKDKQFHVIKDNRSYNVTIVAADHPQAVACHAAKTWSILVNGNTYNVELKDKYDLLLKELGMESLSSKKVNEIRAPMPGLVLNMIVKKGSRLKKGDKVMVLEAMKMENVLRAPGPGTVKSLEVKKGDTVDKNQVLVVLG